MSQPMPQVVGPLTMRKPAAGSLLLAGDLKVAAPLDPNFAPYKISKKVYLDACVAQKAIVRTLHVAVERHNGLIKRLSFPVFPAHTENFNDSLVYAYLQIMFTIVQTGAFKVYLSGPSEICNEIKREFSPTGKACFPVDLMSQVYTSTNQAFEVVRVAQNDLPAAKDTLMKVGLDTSGNRIAFDLGKSDVKVVATKDGEVIYDTEYEWDIYNPDPTYHYELVLGKLMEAKAALGGKLDALGGSSAGVPINEECVWCDCFPRVSPADFQKTVVPIFKNWATALNDGKPGLPLKVINDGEVTALAGYQMLSGPKDAIPADMVKLQGQVDKFHANPAGVFGISMGSNCGAGYINGAGEFPSFLNELWLAPIDFSPNAWECFFTGEDTLGMTSMAFGQRAAEKLVPLAGLEAVCPDEMLAQHKLLELQKIMGGKPLKVSGEVATPEQLAAATKIYETIGVYLGYATAQFKDFYDFGYFLIVGRVTKGPGGDVIIAKAEEVMAKEFPELACEFVIPDEKTKGIGQCIAAAAMPQVPK